MEQPRGGCATISAPRSAALSEGSASELVGACVNFVLDERFRKLLGRSPMCYLAEWRLQLAADMLKQTSEKIAFVAEAVGHGSEEAFNRAFRRRFGASPSVWRTAAATS